MRASVVLLGFSISLFVAGPVFAGQDCPICGLPVLKDTRQSDYRVSMMAGKKSHDYRCVLCALLDAKGTKGDLTITAPSSEKGKPVKIQRVSGKWSATPETAVFVYIEGGHQECQDRYRSLLSVDALDTYIQTNPKLLKGAKALTLKELLEKV